MEIMCRYLLLHAMHPKTKHRSPSRWEAQADATNLIFSAKTQANPESSVGLMSMGGNTPEILTTLTTDIGKILDGLHRTKIKGSSHFSTGINVAAVNLPTGFSHEQQS